MAATRKLQGEIDRCLKKVTEGVETFEDIWKKVHNATNSNQKEKYEADLKKEIKKLQRLRDQIKSWIASGEIKDKSTLLEYRKLIETQMERFKVVERETKTKAYSKEGLGAAQKLDPAQKEREEIVGWLVTSIDALKLQIDQFESEIESLLAGKKKRLDKDKQDRMEELKTKLEKHRFHIKKLETLLRMLDNMSVEVNQIRRIKDDIEYYIESSQDPDFEENEYIYDDIIGLDEVELSGTGLPSSTTTESNNSQDTPPTGGVGGGGTPTSLTSGASPSIPSSPLQQNALNHSTSESCSSEYTKKKDSESKPVKPTAVKAVINSNFNNNLIGNNNPLIINSTTTITTTNNNTYPSSTTTTTILNNNIAAPLYTTTTLQSTSVKTSVSTTPSKQLGHPQSPPISNSSNSTSLVNTSTALMNHLNNISGNFATVAASAHNNNNINNINKHASQGLDGVNTQLANLLVNNIQQQQQNSFTSNVQSQMDPSLAAVFSIAASSTNSQSPQQQSINTTATSTLPPSLLPPISSVTTSSLITPSSRDQSGLMNSNNIIHQNNKMLSSLSNSLDHQQNNNSQPTIGGNTMQVPVQPVPPPTTPPTIEPSIVVSRQSPIITSRIDLTSSAASPVTSNVSMVGGGVSTHRPLISPANVPLLNGPISNLKINDTNMSLKTMAQQAIDRASSNTAPSVQAQTILENERNQVNAISSGNTTAPSVNQLFDQHRNMQEQQKQNIGGGKHTLEAHISPLLGVAPLGPLPLTKEHQFQFQMMEAAYFHMPQPSDTEKIKPHINRNPYQTPSYYPQQLLSHADTVEYFQRLSTETLFFVFYFMEGTKAQYLAAKALKKQSWRFHTKYMMWFQRHEEPKIINEEYEQGTYIYFDYEKWGQRKKEGFTFEYKYLEDRELN